MNNNSNKPTHHQATWIAARALKKATKDGLSQLEKAYIVSYWAHHMKAILSGAK